MDCVNCGVTVNPNEPARYDVFGTGTGPFCHDCFLDTATGKHLTESEQSAK